MGAEATCQYLWTGETGVPALIGLYDQSLRNLKFFDRFSPTVVFWSAIGSDASRR
jgi:hypothetical protein